uniref:Uncharacterized protein n=1 Tax=Anguilla anguilla TaxID=7936 RepID=A0A0E9WSS9_ANGAN
MYSPHLTPSRFYHSQHVCIKGLVCMPEAVLSLYMDFYSFCFIFSANFYRLLLF